MTAPSKRLVKLIVFSAASLALAGALVGTLVVVANSQPSSPEKLNVSYADLDLNSADGAAVLYHRIRVAAGTVCSIYDSRDLRGAALRKSCTDRAVAQAVATVSNPELSDQYLTQTHAQVHRYDVLVATR
jgi:UrcA family protein